MKGIPSFHGLGEPGLELDFVKHTLFGLDVDLLVVQVSGIFDVEVLGAFVVDPVIDDFVGGVVKFNFLDDFVAEHAFEFNGGASGDVMGQMLKPKY